MGAKVASLPSNQRGIRFRSCKNGKVHEVVLCKRDGVYGRLKRLDQVTGDRIEVADVTALAEAEGKSSDAEWTEVVLFGNRSDQNTVRDPYDGDPAQDAQWLATYLYHRFYRLPPGVKLTLNRGTHKLDGNRSFQTIPSRKHLFEKFESVKTESGVIIHYIYDAPYGKATGAGHNKSVSGAMTSDMSTCAIIYRDEMYDLRKGRKWTFDAPIFGVPFGAKHISIHIELPEDSAVIPDGYRQFLRYVKGEQPHVSASDFAELVRENRPQWLIEIIRSLAPDSAANDDLRDELQKLLDSLRVKRVGPRVTQAGALLAVPGAGAGADGGTGGSIGHGEQRRLTSSSLELLPTGSKKAQLFENLERVPEIIKLFDDAEIEEKGIKGREARYIMEASQLFVNMRYTAVEEMRSQLEMEYSGTSDPETMRSLVQRHSEDTMILRVGRTVVYALAKQLNKEWDQRSLETASSPESLSMAADDYLDALQNVRRAIGKALRMNREKADAA